MISGFHLEPTNICTLKCSGCARTRFIEQWPQHWRNHNLDVDAVLKFLDIDINGKLIRLAGNYGDPIYHPDFIEFVKKIKDRGANVAITTNGSYKKQEWWEELVEYLSHNDIVNFSVDGTPDNFTQYRVNGDWESIRVGMNIVAKSNCDSTWKYIPFSFNQHDIDEVERLSVEIGIKRFQLQFSDRFDEKTQNLLPDPKFVGSRYTLQNNWKSNQHVNVNPKCNDGQEHFITADGYYVPCCYLPDHRFYYKTPFGKNKNQYDIRTTTVTEILARSNMIEFYQTLDQQPGCQFNCPKTNG
jgi:MoaA/NifB/PqqE/SkfB family radical SAM enzyme